MAEVWQEAKKTIKGFATIISPSKTRSENRYSLLDPKEDKQSTGSNKEDQQPTKTNNNQSESDSDSEYDTMTKPEAKKSRTSWKTRRYSSQNNTHH